MTRAALEIVGNRYGRAVVVSRTDPPPAKSGKPPRKSGLSFFMCRCDCGAEFKARGSSLVFGGIQSCGCLRREKSAQNALKALAKGRATQASRRASGEAMTDGPHRESYVSAAAYKRAPTWHGIEEAARDLANALGLLGAPA